MKIYLGEIYSSYPKHDMETESGWVLQWEVLGNLLVPLVLSKQGMNFGKAKVNTLIIRFD